MWEVGVQLLRKTAIGTAVKKIVSFLWPCTVSDLWPIQPDSGWLPEGVCIRHLTTDNVLE